MGVFLYNIGQVLIGTDGELVRVLETFIDAHTYQKDYKLQTIKAGIHRRVGATMYIDKSICETWFKEATAQEQVLYGK